MGDEIMIERMENAYNRRMSAYSRGGMYAPYDPEEDEIFSALYCVSLRDRPGATDEGGNQNGRGYGRNEYECM